MEIVWSREIDSILSVGKYLKNSNINNWGLTRSEALSALEQLSQIDVCVLGGDVLSIDGDSIRHNYDNWYSEPKPGESKAEFIERSLTESKTYIANYPLPDTDILFAIDPMPNKDLIGS